MFKFPYTDFNKLNLNWILRKLSELEPAIPMVQQASTILGDAIHMNQQTQSMMTGIQDALNEAVNRSIAASSLAARANETAHIADQKADSAVTTASGAGANANLAYEAATTALETANNASTLAAGANSNAGLAYQTATEAAATAAAALSKTTWSYHGTLTTSGALLLPSEWTEIMLVLYLSGSPSVSKQSLIVPNVNNIPDFPADAELHDVYTFTLSGYGDVQINFTANTAAFYMPGATQYRAVVLYK